MKFIIDNIWLVVLALGSGAALLIPALQRSGAKVSVLQATQLMNQGKYHEGAEMAWMRFRISGIFSVEQHRRILDMDLSTSPPDFESLERRAKQDFEEQEAIRRALF